MVIKYKKKTWVEKNVKIRFAFWPHEDSGTGEFFWLEPYYFYDDDWSWYIVGRTKNYKSKEEFWHKCGGKG